MPKHSLLKIFAISVERLEPFLNLLITDLMHNNWAIKMILELAYKICAHYSHFSGVGKTPAELHLKNNLLKNWLKREVPVH